MNDIDILTGKRILLVDDEPDILETLTELLDMCIVDTASSFIEAVMLLKKKTYNAAILDIMGVKGYDLLEATSKLKIPTIMLTAHAFSPDNLKKSIELGADAYVPKDKLVDITIFLADILSARQKGQKDSQNWFSSMKPVFNKLFGTDWRDEDRTFWDEFDKKFIELHDDSQEST